jgi:hypothetical protein
MPLNWSWSLETCFTFQVPSEKSEACALGCVLDQDGGLIASMRVYSAVVSQRAGLDPVRLSQCLLEASEQRALCQEGLVRQQGMLVRKLSEMKRPSWSGRVCGLGTPCL